MTCLCRKSTYVRSLPIILKIVLQIAKSKEILLFCGKYIIIYGVRGSFLKSTVTRERPRPKKCIFGLAWRWRIMFASILFPPKKRPRKKTTPRRDCLDLLPHLNSKLWGKPKEVFLVSPPFLLFLLPPGHTLQGQGSTHTIGNKKYCCVSMATKDFPSAPLCETSRFVAIRKRKRKEKSLF